MSDLAETVNPALSAAFALAAEYRRRKNAAEFKSVLHDPKHKLSDLNKPARYKVLYGGRGALKSWGVAEYLLEAADNEKIAKSLGPERILCTREYQTSIKDSVHQLLRDQIERMGLIHRFRVTDKAITNNITKSFFIFKGLHNNVQEIKSTEGVTKCWNEEAQGTTEDSWQTLIPTIRKEGSEIIATFNTTDEQAPTYKRFVENAELLGDDLILHKLNYDENPFFPEVLRKEMEYLKRVDYEAYLHVWEGFPKKFSEAVIFGKRIEVRAFDDNLWKKASRLHFGADFGFARDPSTLIRFFIIDNTLYIEYEAYGVGVELNEMKEFYESVPLSNKWPIKADSARPETISYLRGKGFTIRAAEKWKGSVEDGIAHIKAFDKIVIHDRCKHAQEEGRLYSFKTDRVSGDVLPIIIDKHNHVWDAIRYGLDGFIQRQGDLGIWQKLGQQAKRDKGLRSGK